MSKISIISPCFNEELNVKQCCEAVAALFAPGGPLAHHTLEHIFSDNASSDGTVEILRGVAASDPRVKVIVNARNFGPFRSMFNALRYATGDAVLVFLPVDLQDPPDLIPDFVKLWEAGFEIVAGARANRDESFVLRACRRLFYRITNKLSEFEIPEDVGEFQLIDRKVWTAVTAYGDQYPFVRGIIASTGFRRVIVPYNWATRKRGISKNNLFNLIDQALNGVFAFTSAPLRICSFFGMVVSALAFIYAVFALIVALVSSGPVPPGIHTLIVAVFFFSGVQLMSIGLLGEYIKSIHAQVRRIPLVIEREKINF